MIFFHDISVSLRETIDMKPEISLSDFGEISKKTSKEAEELKR